MQARITIKMDNAAFEDAPASELARILRDLAAAVQDGGQESASLRDINGNQVGTFEIRD